MAPQNRAAWLLKKQDKVQVVQDAPYSAPGEDEVVIRTAAVAINPADSIIQQLGIIVDEYPGILGCDAAGVVEEVGSGVAASAFRPGDRVLGATKPMPGGVNKYAGFQRYVVLKLPLVAKIPDHVPFTDAVVLPLGILASSTCLFHPTTLGLAVPPLPSHAAAGPPPKRNEVLIVWGASSSVGACGTQLAVAAGYEVFGIASRKNHGMVQSLGASRVFDQSDATLADDLVAALSEGDPSTRPTCAGALAAIADPETLKTLCDVLDRADGRKIVTSVMPGAENFATKDVSVRTNFACADYGTTSGRYLWREWLEPALAAGTLQYAPRPDVVGHGLEDIQKGCDVLAAGVSAKKVVVSL